MPPHAGLNDCSVVQMKDERGGGKRGGGRGGQGRGLKEQGRGG